MRRQLQQVINLHAKMDFYYGGEPRDLPEDEKVHRVKQLREEIDEYETAETDHDRCDALIDLLYFLLGAVHRHGYEHAFIEGFEDVHCANMQKSVGENPTRPGFGKDLFKPPGWEAPDLQKYFVPGLQKYFK